MRHWPLLLLGLLACSPRLPRGTLLIEETTTVVTVGQHLRISPRAEDCFTFVGVAEDSRCPRGVQCVRAGRAVVTVDVRRSGRMVRDRVTVDGNAIITDCGPLQLQSLSPYPEATPPEPREPYRLSVRLVDEATEVPPDARQQ